MDRFIIHGTITAKKHSEQVLALAKAHGAVAKVELPARGTAKSSLLETLGLERHSQQLILSCVPEKQAEALLRAELHSLELRKQGRGIAFNLPVEESLGLRTLLRWRAQEKERELAEVRRRPWKRRRVGGGLELAGTAQAENSELAERVDLRLRCGRDVLLCFILPEGHAEALMLEARRLGVGGGTIIHGRGFSAFHPAVVFGLPVDPHKDLLLIVHPLEEGPELLAKLARCQRLEEPGRGISFALPLLHTAGI